VTDDGDAGRVASVAAARTESQF